MKIHFLKPDLHQMDQVHADTIAVGLFEEDRPPRGLAGLADWRLCGRVSRLIASGNVTGRFREAVLFPGYARLPAHIGSASWGSGTGPSSARRGRAKPRGSSRSRCGNSGPPRSSCRSPDPP